MRPDVIKGSEIRKADFPIEQLLLDRWSPRAMSGEEIAEEELTGAAWENFALQGFRQGLVVHGMEGFDYERARVELRIPDEFQVEAMAAVGKPGVKEVLPEKLQKRESPNDRRKLSESICEGPFRF